MKLSELIQELTKTLNQLGDKELTISGVYDDGYSYTDIVSKDRYLPGKFLMAAPKPKYQGYEPLELPGCARKDIRP